MTLSSEHPQTKPYLVIVLDYAMRVCNKEMRGLFATRVFFNRWGIVKDQIRFMGYILPDRLRQLRMMSSYLPSDNSRYARRRRWARHGWKYLRPLLFACPAEWTHQRTFSLLQILNHFPAMRQYFWDCFAPCDPLLANHVCGMDFAGPLGLAAGFDKNGQGTQLWGALGFSYAEVGTVTPLPQSGNPPPRLFRLPADEALLNRMGFNNGGLGPMVNYLACRDGRIPIGVNIGKNKLTPAYRAINDYCRGAHRLGPWADYLVVNVSSPNTPGLRELQHSHYLEPILRGVCQETDKPVFVKISPDLSDEHIDQIAMMCLQLGLAGIVATNTTIRRDQLRSAHVEALGSGGISGRPLKERSLQILRRLYRQVGSQCVLISVGGISSAQDVFERITAGATLVQAYTGWIYGGPTWAWDVQTQLGALLRQQGYHHISHAIGAHAH